MTAASIGAALTSDRAAAPPSSSTGSEVRCPLRIARDDLGSGVGSRLAPTMASRLSASWVDSPREPGVLSRVMTSDAGSWCQASTGGRWPLLRLAVTGWRALARGAFVDEAGVASHRDHQGPHVQASRIEGHEQAAGHGAGPDLVHPAVAGETIGQAAGEQGLAADTRHAESGPSLHGMGNGGDGGWGRHGSGAPPWAG